MTNNTATTTPIGPRSVGVRLITGTCADGFEIDSRYVEEFWTPVVGPTGILLLRTIARIPLHLDSPSHATIDLDLLSQMLGLRFKGGQHSSIVRTITRLTYFELASSEETDTEYNIAIPNRVRPVEAHHQKNWSDVIIAGHDIALALHRK